MTQFPTIDRGLGRGSEKYNPGWEWSQTWLTKSFRVWINDENSTDNVDGFSLGQLLRFFFSIPNGGEGWPCVGGGRPVNLTLVPNMFKCRSNFNKSL